MFNELPHLLQLYILQQVMCFDGGVILLQFILLSDVSMDFRALVKKICLMENHDWLSFSSKSSVTIQETIQEKLVLSTRPMLLEINSCTLTPSFADWLFARQNIRLVRFKNCIWVGTLSIHEQDEETVDFEYFQKTTVFRRDGVLLVCLGEIPSLLVNAAERQQFT